MASRKYINNQVLIANPNLDITDNKTAIVKSALSIGTRRHINTLTK